MQYGATSLHGVQSCEAGSCTLHLSSTSLFLYTRLPPCVCFVCLCPPQVPAPPQGLRQGWPALLPLECRHPTQRKPGGQTDPQAILQRPRQCLLLLCPCASAQQWRPLGGQQRWVRCFGLEGRLAVQRTRSKDRKLEPMLQETAVHCTALQLPSV